jgi:hypothetical protein
MMSAEARLARADGETSDAKKQDCCGGRGDGGGADGLGAAGGPCAAEGSTSLPVSTAAVYVQAEIDPGAAKTFGIKLGDGSSAKPLEVAFTGRHLAVDGVPVPFLIPARDKALKLHAYAHKDMLTVWANDCFFFEKPVKFQQAGVVTAFSTGGPAALAAMTVQDIKPAPTTKTGYFCGCAHGAILWNPE